MKPIIRVENLSKQYTIGGPAEPYSTLRESLVKTVKAPFNAFRNGCGNGNEQFWALKDINFEVMPGEVVGIIGRNGAGKSTLLKILSRITEPTTGKVDLYGRVGSLLEVGTGFHPELTGRENIYLNGAILGMKREEISKKFDEIVDFAEIEEFLDTPVKRYSSGMYMRLAFAVAANLEPEILIVDEVLAVGDAAFQNKCINKMKNVSTEQGRTVLFVSHNIQAIRQLCTTTAFMANGLISLMGDTTDAISLYLGNTEKGASDIALHDFPRNSASRNGSFQVIQYRGKDGSPVGQCDRSQEFCMRIAIKLTAPVKEFDLAIGFTHAEGIKVFSEVLSDRYPKADLSQGDYVVSVTIPARFLKVGSYSVALCALYEGRVIDAVDGIPAPEIVDPLADKNIESHRWGVVRIPVVWVPVQTV